MPPIVRPSPQLLARIAKARQHITRACNGNSGNYYRTVSRHAETLKEKYHFYDRVILYHLMIGGTVDFREHTIFDFPDPDSVFTYLEQLAHLLEHLAPS